MNVPTRGGRPRRISRWTGWMGALLALVAGLAVAEETEGEMTIAPTRRPSSSLSPSAVIHVEDVEASARAFFPLLQAFRLESEARQSAVTGAAGAFDTKLSASGDVQALGFYENRAGAAKIDQPTRLWGSRFYGGYRYGEGDFASYDGKELTDSSGEVQVGLEIPLLRGGAIDQRRAKLQKAQLDESSFNPELELERIKTTRDARMAYWEWVATGKVVEVARGLLEVAEARQSQIERRVNKGQEAEINLSDNQRLVLERRAKLRGAERDFRQAAIFLSLYLRDSEGNPRRIDETGLPPGFPSEELMAARAIESDLKRARETHPLLRKVAIEREKLEVEYRLARNTLLPALDLAVEGSRDFGRSRAGIDEVGKLSAESRSATELGVRVGIEIPLQQRKARGRTGVAKVRLEQIKRRIQMLRDRVEVRALQSLEALEAAYDQTRQARDNSRLAEQLRTAESRKLGAGLSNLIDVNIREVQAASAAENLVRAQRDFFRARAEYEASVARDD